MVGGYACFSEGVSGCCSEPSIGSCGSGGLVLTRSERCLKGYLISYWRDTYLSTGWKTSVGSVAADHWPSLFWGGTLLFWYSWFASRCPGSVPEK